jgi:hypothetical protein
MRPTQEIFEDVLDAFDVAQTERIMAATGLSDPVEDLMERHFAEVRKYREEFREAMQQRQTVGIDWGSEPSYSVTHTVSHGPDGPVLDIELEVPLSAPEQALADANPSTYPEILPPGQPVKPPRVGPGDHGLRPAEAETDPSLYRAQYDERPDERGERLAERHTRDDGSSR